MRIGSWPAMDWGELNTGKAGMSLWRWPPFLSKSWPHTMQLIDSWHPSCEFSLGQTTVCCSFSPSVPLDTGRCWVWNCMQEFEAHKECVKSTAFAPTDVKFATASTDSTLKVSVSSLRSSTLVRSTIGEQVLFMMAEAFTNDGILCALY